MYTNLIHEIASELKVDQVNAVNAVRLLFTEDATVPFVARYRKEQTGSMNDITLHALKDRYKYAVELESTKERYLKIISERAKIDSKVTALLPQIKEKFANCRKKNELEDLYLPFKSKRQTRATKAKALGAEAILDCIWKNEDTIKNLDEFISATLKDLNLDKITDSEHALQLASDIFAEQISEDFEKRKIAREVSFKTGVLKAEKNEKFIPQKNNQPSRYENYYDYQEPINRAASHRIMAVRRGEADKALKVRIEVAEQEIIESLETLIVKDNHSDSLKQWVIGAIKDSYKRLMKPAIETEIRLSLRTRAEEEAIGVFNKNLRKLLMLNPIPNEVVMAIDPGLRTGSKIAILSETGKLLDYTVIHFNPKIFQDPRNREPIENIVELIKKYKVSYISVGNGTGSREADFFLDEVLKFYNLSNLQKIIVNEAGASIYSTDKLARDEFPDLDPVIRSAVSIGRRLQDPLAELVKIDPKSVGIGQYQHDCAASKLNDTLKTTVEYCVNKVGVNINTASYKLLENISGISLTLAKSIVDHRDKCGPFKTREELKQVKGFSDKVFQLSAGFLRVVDGESILDSTAIHPERYNLIKKIAEDVGMDLEHLIRNKDVVKTINLSEYVNETVGLSTLLDIAAELINPGRDPRLRNTIKKPYKSKVMSIKDLKVGMSLKGAVSNVTNFGVFVDIGVHQDGLIHISEMADVFVKDPSKVMSVGDVVNVRVLNVDYDRKRISLTCKSTQSQNKERVETRKPRTNGLQNQVGNHNYSKGRSFKSNPRSQRVPNGRNLQSFSVNDLMDKFNSNNSNN